MKYKITIERLIEDPEFAENLKEYNSDRSRYCGSNLVNRPSEFKVDRVLEVELTEEEYTKMKQEVITIFK